MEAKIIFKDGTEMTVEKNGDCCIAEKKPTFPADLTLVVIQSEEGNREIADAELVECASTDGRYWFTFIAADPRDREIAKLREDNDMLTECVLELSEIVYA